MVTTALVSASNEENALRGHKGPLRAVKFREVLLTALLTTLWPLVHGHTRHRDIIRRGGRADDSIGHICHPGIPGIGPRDAVVDYLDKSRSDIIDKPFDTAATDFLFPAARPGPGHEQSSGKWEARQQGGLRTRSSYQKQISGFNLLITWVRH